MVFCRSLFALAILCPPVLVGCGGNRPVPVTGTITLDGQPLPKAQLSLSSDENGRPASGESDSQGKFSLTTFSPNDGILPGHYKVTVTVRNAEQQKLNEQMNDPKLSVLERAKLFKTMNKLPSPLHANYTKVDKTPLSLDVPPKGPVKFELNKDGT